MTGLRGAALTAALSERLQTSDGLILIDPFLASAGAPGWVRQTPPVIAQLPPARLVLLTHEHDDHADPVALRQIAEQPGCMVAGSMVCVEIAQASGVPADQTKTLQPGDQFSIGDVKIHALEVQDDSSVAPLAYLINVDDKAVYHGGDAQFSALFAKTGAAYQVDYCCLATAGVVDGEQHYLSPAQAVQAANLLGATTLIPTHWELWTLNSLPQSVWETYLHEAGLCVRVLEPGQYSDISS
jgi:L-ascorbate 6-phosphate lactonase